MLAKLFALNKIGSSNEAEVITRPLFSPFLRFYRSISLGMFHTKSSPGSKDRSKKVLSSEYKLANCPL